MKFFDKLFRKNNISEEKNIQEDIDQKQNYDKESGQVEDKEKSNCDEEVKKIDSEEKNDIESLEIEEEGILEINELEVNQKNIYQADELQAIQDNVIEDTILGEQDLQPIEEIQDVEKKKGFFAKLKEGLNKTRQNIIDGIDSVLSSFTKIDEELFEELEESLIMSDIGIETTTLIVENLRQRVKKEHITDASLVKQLLIDEITQILEEGESKLELNNPSIILVIGVNGVGKTTTIGKLANIYKQQGNKVLLAAADTFRAAAIDQLEIWGKRSGIDVIRHQENSDPAAVIYDAVQAAKARKSDILICDTAGRLHNKKNLMEELKKIFKIINRDYEQAHKEVFLVLDGTTGQNALQQAKLFKEVADITGIVLTKLDGTAKGGIIIAIKSELKIPVRYIGIGEGINDLQEFNSSDFAKALFNVNE